jgi:hypothetical protein
MRSRRISRLVVVWALAAAAACSSKVAPETTPAPSAPPAADAGGARTITLEVLEASLASFKPSTVVFDIDDTTLYTGSPSSSPRAISRRRTQDGFAMIAGSGPSSTTASMRASASPSGSRGSSSPSTSGGATRSCS